MKRLYGMELFVEVARARSFSRAADALGMPKSTLSRQVAELERAVGVRLLSRTTRKVALTEAGERYLERCERIVAEAQIAHEELQHLVSTPTGPLRVNMPADFGTDFLAAAFVEFSKRYPAVTFHLDLAAPEHAGQVFHTCDVSIEIGELPDSTQIARLLGAIPAMLYAAPQYIAVHGFPRHPDELAKHEFLEFRSSQANRATAWPLRSGKEQVMVQPKSRFSVNSIAMLRQLAVRGVGIAGLDEAGCEAEVRAGRLVRVLPDWHGGPFPVYAVTETRLLPAKTSIFVDFLAEWLTRHWSLGSGPALIGQRPKAVPARPAG
ncbi:LysR family transcriptional regulator [Alcaligenaceae bacterium C4P045]|nr:LysR family transcriptional regulator [Alcaligenaceae bacterium B3P038]MDQ2149387.1 LysR family transcriptional regulator [Alcaligenaceae bacterium C4P045]